MEPSINKAIAGFHSTTVGDEQQLRTILLDFFKDRAIEILIQLEKRDLMLEETDIKIGGTNPWPEEGEES